MKKTKIAICVLLLFVMVLSLSACRYAYVGWHTDLYTVAMYNVFGAAGFMDGGEPIWDSEIFIIETDNYGRVLFFYDEYLAETNYGTAIVIMQKSDRDYVYYYQDDCYTPYFNTDRQYPFGYRDAFSDEDIEALKLANDWNKEINLDKCTKSEITNKIPSGQLEITRKEFNAVLMPYVKTLGYKGDDTIYRFSNYCNTDKYGRELYYVYGIGSDVDGEGVSPSSKKQNFEFAMIFNPDKSCPSENIYLITDPTLTPEALKVLKQNAGWNQPYENS